MTEKLQKIKGSTDQNIINYQVIVDEFLKQITEKSIEESMKLQEVLNKKALQNDIRNKAIEAFKNSNIDEIIGDLFDLIALKNKIKGRNKQSTL